MRMFAAVFMIKDHGAGLIEQAQPLFDAVNSLKILFAVYRVGRVD